MVSLTEEFHVVVPELPAEQLAGDRISPGHPLFGLIWVNPNRMHGTPCFYGTRVPVDVWFEHLEAGDPEGFFIDFPNVTRAQATAVSRAAARSLLAGLR
jgi:uncharacterized protein (DUF433 family)